MGERATYSIIGSGVNNSGWWVFNLINNKTGRYVDKGKEFLAAKRAEPMTTNTLSSYALALAILLAMIFTVSWGVQQLLINLTDSQKVATQPGKRVKFSL